MGKYDRGSKFKDGIDGSIEYSSAEYMVDMMVTDGVGGSRRMPVYRYTGKDSGGSKVVLYRADLCGVGGCTGGCSDWVGSEKFSKVMGLIGEELGSSGSGSVVSGADNVESSYFAHVHMPEAVINPVTGEVVNPDGSRGIVSPVRDRGITKENINRVGVIVHESKYGLSTPVEFGVVAYEGSGSVVVGNVGIGGSVGVSDEVVGRIGEILKEGEGKLRKDIDGAFERLKGGKGASEIETGKDLSSVESKKDWRVRLEECFEEDRKWEASKHAGVMTPWGEIGGEVVGGPSLGGGIYVGSENVKIGSSGNNGISGSSNGKSSGKGSNDIGVGSSIFGWGSNVVIRSPWGELSKGEQEWLVGEVNRQVGLMEVGYVSVEEARANAGVFLEKVQESPVSGYAENMVIKRGKVGGKQQTTSTSSSSSKLPVNPSLPLPPPLKKVKVKVGDSNQFSGNFNGSDYLVGGPLEGADLRGIYSTVNRNSVNGENIWRTGYERVSNPNMGAVGAMGAMGAASITGDIYSTAYTGLMPINNEKSGVDCNFNNWDNVKWGNGSVVGKISEKAVYNYNISVDGVAPSIGAVPAYYGASNYIGEPDYIAGYDIAGGSPVQFDSSGFVKSGVSGIKGIPVTNVPLSEGNCLSFNGSCWVPTPMSVMGSVVVDRVRVGVEGDEYKDPFSGFGVYRDSYSKPVSMFYGDDSNSKGNSKGVGVGVGGESGIEYSQVMARLEGLEQLAGQGRVYHRQDGANIATVSGYRSQMMDRRTGYERGVAELEREFKRKMASMEREFSREIADFDNKISDELEVKERQWQVGGVSAARAMQEVLDKHRTKNDKGSGSGSGSNNHSPFAASPFGGQAKLELVHPVETEAVVIGFDFGRDEDLVAMYKLYLAAKVSIKVKRG